MLECQCECVHYYTVMLDRRKFYRKSTDLPGVYSCQKTNLSGSHKSEYKDDRGFMRVTDISRSGLKIRVNGAQTFLPGDRLYVEFNLDDRARSYIKKSVIVRSLQGQCVGMEFITIENFDKLGACLLK